MSEIPIFTVDAFVGALQGRVLRGNPAAVVFLDAPRDAEWMQEVAAEMNLSETAFVTQNGANSFDLRWFTPVCEVALCGHATLASAHILWENGRIRPETEAQFHTLIGVLTAQKRGEQIALDFPAQGVEAVPPLPDLSRALGIEDTKVLGWWAAEDDWLVEVVPGTVESLRPLFGALRSLSRARSLRGVIVTEKARANAPIDFISRFFAPGVGIDEDPVTGSAHTKLAPFWGARLGRNQMVGFQASKRGGLVGVNWQDERVELLGRAQTRLRGQWLF